MTSLSEFRLRVGAAAAALLILCATPSKALDPHRMISQYARDRWALENEFPGGAISAIAQTPDGYLWIGTEKGLFRFDGLSFRVFQQASPESLPIGPVQKLMTDNNGNLWVLLANTKLLRFHDGKFELGREQAEVGVTAIGKRANGAPLFASLAYGALTYQDGKFLSISPSSELSSAATAPSSDDLSTRLSWATSVAAHSLAQPDTVTSAVETSDGRVWLGTRDKGLFYLEHGRISHIHLPGVSRNVQSILPLDNGDLWIGTGKGIFLWNGKGVSQIGISPALRQADVRAMIRDRDANIWLGTSAGLLRVNKDGVHFDDVGPDHAKPVTALFEDREGNLWIGRSQGVERLRETAFVTYPFKTAQEESGGPVFVDTTGRVWFGSFNGGLQWFRQAEGGTVSIDGLNHDVVYSITGDENELWVGRQRGGLTRLRYGAGQFRARTYTVSDGLPENSVYAVYRSRDGSVWAATLNAGISQFVDGHFKNYFIANGLPSNTITAIDESPDGTMWFGTRNGLVAYSRNTWNVFTAHNGLPNDNITCLLADSTGSLWIGTVSGLAVLQSGHIRKPDSMPLSLREEILGIAGDNIGNLWMATSNHILSVKRERMLSATLSESDIREYGLEDGLIGKQGVKRFRSVFADAHGKIWFSTDRGLAVVDPLRADRESSPVSVQIEGLSADGNSLDLEPSIRVPPDTHRLTFRFSGPSLSDSKRIQFKYKLEGFDKDWSEPVSTRAAVYTNVNWGPHTFRVMASNNAGVWNNQATQLSFSIAPTWYQTRAFRVLLAVSLLLGTWALHRWRVHQLKRQEKRLRDVVETIPALIFTALPDGSTTFVNKRWTEYTGLSVEQSSGVGWRRAIHREDLARHSEKWRISVAAGQLFEHEARFRCTADGGYRWFLVRGVPLRDQHGNIVRWFGTLTDIEDRKRAEEALQRSQFYISEGQRVAHMGSWALNPAGFEYWSSELFRIHGLDPNGKPPTVEEYLALVHSEDRAFMKQGITSILADHRAFDFTRRIVRPDGETRHVRCVGVPVTQGGIFQGFLGTGMDVTEQERLTEELRRSESHLAEAQRLTHTGSWAWRVADRKMVHLSEEFYRICGYDPAEGAPTFEQCFERVHPEDRLKWKGVIEQAIVEKAEYDREFRIVLPNGTVKWIHTVGHPVFSDAGDLKQFVGSSTDITELKWADQEREKLRQLEANLAHTNRVSTLGEMAASLAHEIKQPIAAAITSANSCIEWLAHEPPNLDRARAAAARIDKYGNRAAEIIDRIRSFYKKSPPQRELVEVNRIIREILTLLDGEAIRSSVAIRTELAAELPVVMTDRVQLQQVFMNLTLNAIEAMKDSGGDLTVKSQLEQDGQLLFSVSDTGPGLPSENVDQIFSAFFTTKSKGSGMGLAISRSIVESHGGRLWATANNGRGVTFHFTLPTEVP